MPKLTIGKVTPVKGSTARLPATVTANCARLSTTQATPIQLSRAWASLANRPAPATSRGSPRVTRPWCRIKRCSQTAQPSTAAHAAALPKTPTIAVKV